MHGDVNKRLKQVWYALDFSAENVFKGCTIGRSNDMGKPQLD